jgi:hypothetical protein
MKPMLFVAALVVWTVLAFLFIFMLGMSPCVVLQPVGELGPGETFVPWTEAEYAAALAARCNRPDVGQILFFGAGYLVLAAIAINHVRGRRTVEPT